MRLSVIEQIEKYLYNENIDKIIDNLYKIDEEPITFGHGLSSFEFDSIAKKVKKKKRKGKSMVQFLTDKMIERGIIQQKLAEDAGLLPSYITNLKNGQSGSKYKLLRIALVLQLNLEETKELLEIDGKTFDYSIKDKIIISCINLGIFDLIKVEEALNRVENANETLY